MVELTALSSRTGRAVATFLKFVFAWLYSEVYKHFIFQIVTVPTVNNFQNRLTVDEVLAKFDATFF